MSPDSQAVECVGSFALVDLWQVDTSISSQSVSLGTWGGSVIGNDAVIVAHELRSRGVNARCRLLDPTSADIALISSVLPPETVLAIGRKTGETTRSLCLEDALGHRRWVFSRLPEPNGDLGEIKADVVYIDYYPEFVGYLNRSLAHLRVNNQLVIVNLSGITSMADVPPLVMKPAVTQASISHDPSIERAAWFALELAKVTNSRRAVVTMGARGAVLAMGKTTWHSVPKVISGKTILGSGAVFSSEMIIGLLEGLDGDELLEHSIRQTGSRLLRVEPQ